MLMKVMRLKVRTSCINPASTSIQLLNINSGVARGSEGASTPGRQDWGRQNE